MKIFKIKSFFYSFSFYFKMLPVKKKIKLFFLFLLMLFSALIETITIAFIALFISSISNPGYILQSKYIIYIQKYISIDFLQDKNILIFILSILVVILLIISSLSRFFLTYALLNYSYFTSQHVGKELLNGFLNMPYKKHFEKNTSDLILAVAWRIHVGKLFDGLLRVFLDVSMTAIILSYLFITELLVSLIVIIIVGIGAIFIFSIIRPFVSKLSKSVRDLSQKINRDVTKSIHGIKDVKIYGCENLYIQEFKNNSYKEARIIALQSSMKELPKMVLNIFGFLMISLSIFIMLFLLKFSTEKIVSILTLFAVSSWRILPAIGNVLQKFTEIQICIPFIEAIIKYFNEISTSMKELKSSKENKNLTFKTDIVIKNVSFSYSSKVKKNVLNNINLEIKKGNTVGIIGHSGSGKSTLVDIIIGILIPTKGSVLIDNLELDESLRKKWTKHIGYVSQSPYIFDGTLAENVAFGIKRENIDFDRVRECCKMASMDDFINELPKGYETPIGERGVKLSGGQRQRVAIARALYNKPDLIIFDEATSSLDKKNEGSIINTIYRLKKEITLVIVSHKLNAVEDCGIVIWLEDSKIRDQGEPDKILLNYKKYSEEMIMNV